MDFKSHPSTRSVHSKTQITPSAYSILPLIVENAAFAFADLENWRAVALREIPGDTYIRNSNPTERQLEAIVAALEGAQTGLSFSTGMSAVHTTLFALLDPGQRAVSIRDAYGTTYLHFTQILPRFGIECQVCETMDELQILVK